jgi:preprotein translocase subunit SecG
MVILVQNKNVSLNLSTMSGWMWAVTKRWPEKVLHNANIFLWAIFIINSIALFLLSK